MQRIKRALAAVAMTGVLLGFGGAVSGGAVTASAAPSDQSSQTTFEGTLPPGTSTSRFASCGDVGYVERGANHALPRLNVVADANISVAPVIAWDTVPNAFGSRAVTSMWIWIHNVDTSDYHRWQVTWYCTPDKSKAWLVFG